MLNMIRNIRRLNISRIAVACSALLLILAPGSAQSQSPGSSYTARGIAPVSGGNIAEARTAALNDAQQKVVLAALADQMPFAKLNSLLATLQNLFINRPDVYVQRFKILNETTISDSYHILIEAFTENELLRKDLESMGVNAPSQQKTAALLLIAETSSGERYASWWAPDPTERLLPLDVGEQMAFFFRERGIAVLDNARIPVEPLAPIAGEVFPGREAVLMAASRAGADIVVLAKADLKQMGAQPDTSFAQVQCDLSAEVLDVYMRELVLQTTTNALGMHIDQRVAAQDAASKACSRIVEQILDRMPAAKNERHTYALRCTFPGARPAATSMDFFRLLREALPEIVELNVREVIDAHVRIADIVSTVDGAALVQKALQTKPGGFRLAPGAVEETVINLTVTLPGGSTSAPGDRTP
jgi:hypothetical protein